MKEKIKIYLHYNLSEERKIDTRQAFHNFAISLVSPAREFPTIYRYADFDCWMLRNLGDEERKRKREIQETFCMVGDGRKLQYVASFPSFIPGFWLISLRQRKISRNDVHLFGNKIAIDIEFYLHYFKAKKETS